MNRDITKLNTLTALSNDNVDGAAIPAGKKLTISKFGAADINLGDNKSSYYILRWGNPGVGFEELAVISVTGGTYEFNLKMERTGDGTKFLRIQRNNNSLVDKRCSAWVKAYDNV
jgi:hypothetical protein